MVLRIIIHQFTGKVIGEVKMDTPCNLPRKRACQVVLDNKLKFILCGIGRS